MKHIRTIIAVSAIAILAACAGRAPQPAAVVRPADGYMDCAQIAAETYANSVQAQYLAAEQRNKDANNIAMGAVGMVLFWPALFALDTKGATEADAAALGTRQQYLAAMAAQRHCGAPQAPPQSAPPPIS